jgi:outer membrane protein assembly factor BamB
MIRHPVLALLSTLTLTLPLHAADWPQWRGPDGQGHSTATGLPLEWSETTNVTWKTATPGRGWSSPVIDGREIWMTTAIETAAKPEDAARRLQSNTGDQPLTVLDQLELRALRIDRDTGKLLRDVLLLTVREPQWAHRLNSYASPTPVLETGRLYAHFGAFGTAALDTKSGQVLWRHTDLVVKHENGPGSTPVVWENLLIFHMDGSDRQFVAALDKRTGRLAWKTDRSGAMNEKPQLQKSYGTPLIVEVAGKPVLFSPGADWLYGYDPATGRELWKVPYGQLGFSITPRPVAGHGMLFMATGFGKKQMLALKIDTMAEPQIAWRYAKGIPTMPSPLLVGNALYFVDDGGFLTSLDARTGVERYRERLGGNFSASPTFADGRIYISSREGVTHVVSPGAEFELLAKNELPGAIMASAAIADGAIFLRTDTALYRLEKKKAATTAKE